MVNMNESVRCEKKRKYFTIQFYKRKSPLSARNGDRHGIDPRYISRGEIELSKTRTRRRCSIENRMPNYAASSCLVTCDS